MCNPMAEIHRNEFSDNRKQEMDYSIYFNRPLTLSRLKYAVAHFICVNKVIGSVESHINLRPFIGHNAAYKFRICHKSAVNSIFMSQTYAGHSTSLQRMIRR